MILAAGLGTRMGPLTDGVPKPLLHAGGKPLLQHQLESLARAGFHDVVINHGRFGDRIETAFGSGARFGLSIRYSAEGDAPLETAGGIHHALPLLGPAPFLVVNADIWTDFDFATLRSRVPEHAHLVLVPNPAHHPRGDFALAGDRVRSGGEPRWTYSGVGVYHPRLFRELLPGPASLAPLLRAAMDLDRISGEVYSGEWSDIGTPDRLAALDRRLRINVTS